MKTMMDSAKTETRTKIANFLKSRADWSSRTLYRIYSIPPTQGINDLIDRLCDLKLAENPDDETLAEIEQLENELARHIDNSNRLG